MYRLARLAWTTSSFPPQMLFIGETESDIPLRLRGTFRGGDFTLGKQDNEEALLGDSAAMPDNYLHPSGLR